MLYGRFIFWCGLTACALCGPPALADITAKWELKASDAKAGGTLGWSSHLSDGKAYVGSSPDETSTNGPPGAIYVFDTATGAQLSRFQAAEAQSGYYFGSTIAVSGNMMATGAFGAAYGADSGAAYRFDVTGSGTPQRLQAPDAAVNDYFGVAVAASGSLLLVSAPRAANGALTEAGALYAFNSNTGAYVRKITNPDPRAGAWFGHSVAVSGSRAVIGADRDDRDAAYAGVAYLMNLDTNQSVPVKSPGPSSLDQFGWSCDTDGNLAIVGAIFDEAGPVSGSGVVYVYSNDGTLLRTLVPNDPATSMNFGYSVAISGRLALVGAPQDSSASANAGAAYLFDVQTGQQLAKLFAPIPQAQDLFGRSVDLDGQTALVTAIDRDLGASNTGAAYVFAVPEPASGAALIMALLTWMRAGRRRDGSGLL